MCRSYQDNILTLSKYSLMYAWLQIKGGTADVLYIEKQKNIYIIFDILDLKLSHSTSFRVLIDITVVFERAIFAGTGRTTLSTHNKHLVHPPITNHLCKVLMSVVEATPSSACPEIRSKSSVKHTLLIRTYSNEPTHITFVVVRSKA